MKTIEDYNDSQCVLHFRFKKKCLIILVEKFWSRLQAHVEVPIDNLKVQYDYGCNFETVGLSRTVASEYFPGVLSKISGIGLSGIENKLRTIHKQAFEDNNSVLPIGGLYRYRKNGETHQYQGKLMHLLQSSVGKFEPVNLKTLGLRFINKSLILFFVFIVISNF